MTDDRDPHDLQRFLDAQAPVYESVRRELRDGRKRSHWMWFVFPQIEGLGSSPTARRFAIRSLAEARAYAAHAVLGSRLRECVELVLCHRMTAHAIFGHPDDLKFHSSMTLFALADEASPCREALSRFFDGEPDAGTLARLGLDQ